MSKTKIYKKGDIVGEFLKKNGFRVFMLDENPTAEYLSKFLYQHFKIILPNLIKVGLVESKEDSVAWYNEV